jgi:hypothetical protein
VVVLMELDFQGVSREDVEALSDDMGARENPPAGLIAHVVTDTANGVHAVDIWGWASSHVPVMRTSSESNAASRTCCQLDRFS